MTLVQSGANTFYIFPTPVTHDMFYDEDFLASLDDDIRDDLPPTDSTLRDTPRNGLTIVQAAAYCDWLGEADPDYESFTVRLPTYTEWVQARDIYGETLFEGVPDRYTAEWLDESGGWRAADRTEQIGATGMRVDSDRVDLNEFIFRCVAIPNF